MRFRIGKDNKRSIDDIEAEAAAEIEKRVALGKPPPEDFAPVIERLAKMDAAGQLNVPAFEPSTESLSASTSTNGHGKGSEHTTVEVESQAPMATPAGAAPDPENMQPELPAVKLNIRKPAARNASARKPAATSRKPATRKPATATRKPAGSSRRAAIPKV